jgi:hypothetical protein
VVEWEVLGKNHHICHMLSWFPQINPLNSTENAQLHFFFSRTWHRFAKGDVETKRAVHLPHWVWGPEELVPRCPCLYYAYCISCNMYNMYTFLWIYPK